MKHVFDGNYSTGWADNQTERFQESLENDYIQVTLAKPAKVDTVSLYPVTSGGKVIAFPKDFTLCVSADGSQWETGTLTEEDVTCYMIANDVELIGSVETSNEMINEFHQMMVRTMLNNMQGKPTDTPWLEKNGWTGDFNVFQRSFNYNFDTAAFTNKFQGDMRDSAYADGVIPVISPTGGWDWGTYNNPVWTTAYDNSLYEGWKFGGQFAQIEAHYEALRAQTLAYIKDSRDKYGWTWAADQLGDWITPEYRGTPIEGSAITGSGYVYQALDRMAEIADVMGKPEDATAYRAAMAEMYKAFNETFYKADKGFYETNKGTAAASAGTQVGGWASNDSTDVSHAEWAMVDLGRTYEG